MSQSDTPYTFDRVVRLVLAGTSIWLTVLLLSSLSEVLLPFAVALTLAYLINPLVELTGKIIKNRMAAVLVTLTLIIVPVGKLLWVALRMVGSELSHIGQLLAILVNDSAAAKRAAEYLPADLWKFVTDLAKNDDVRSFLSEAGVTDMLQTLAHKAVPGIVNLVSGSAQMFVAFAGVFVIILYLVFLLVDYDKLRSWRSQLPEKYRDRVSSFIDEFTHISNRYFRTQALIALIIGCLFSTGFIIIGLPLAILLGMLIGVLNMVPYLQIAGLIPAFLFAGVSALATGTSLWAGLAGVAAVFVVVQIIQDAVLVPKLQGESLGLSPWMILLSLSVWGKLLGFLGLVMALPLSCMALAVYRQYVAGRDVIEKGLET